jgi:hypothetical protein
LDYQNTEQAKKELRKEIGAGCVCAQGQDDLVRQIVGKYGFEQANVPRDVDTRLKRRRL